MKGKTRQKQGLTSDGAVNDRAVLELNRDGLVAELHEEPEEARSRSESAEWPARNERNSMGEDGRGERGRCQRVVAVSRDEED